jgi:hypothetical protein
VKFDNVGGELIVSQLTVQLSAEEVYFSADREKTKEEGSAMTEQWSYSEMTSGQGPDIKILSACGWWKNCSRYQQTFQ